MIWKAHPKLHDGDIRVSIKFAWWPIKTDNYYWVWLQHVIVNEIYTTDYYEDVGKWKTTSVRIKG